MTLQQLKYVIEVADRGSINEAAKSLFVSQPSLSSSIRQLEAELKIKIFTRSNRGIKISLEGSEFLGFAKQVVQKIELMEKKYSNATSSKCYFSVSSQHNELSANAFVQFVKEMGDVGYDLTFREAKTMDVIEDVKNFRSEVGIIYLCNDNNKIFKKILKENHLIFKELFITQPHVFLYSKHPLANRSIIKLNELNEYPCLTFDQGQHHNSPYFLEEILNLSSIEKCIKVSDRGSLINCMIGLNGFLITSKVYLKNLYKNNFLTIPLEVEEKIHFGTILHKDIKLSEMGESYLYILKQLSQEH